MMKKWKCLACILSAALLMSACTKTPTNEGEERETTVNASGGETNESQSKLDVVRPIAYSGVEGLNLESGTYISIIGRGVGTSYWNEVKAGVERAAKDLNEMLGYKGDDKIKVNYSGPSENNNVDEQVNILDEELARYPAAVGIAIVDVNACATQFDLAAENDIPVVAFDSGSDYKGIQSMCSTNNAEAARTAATKLATAVEDEGEIALIVHDTNSTSAKEREEAFLDEIKTNYPDITVVQTYHMDDLKEMAKQMAQKQTGEGDAGTKESELPERKNEAGSAENADQPENRQEADENKEQVDQDAVTQEDVIQYILEQNPNLKGVFSTNVDATQLILKGCEAAEKEDLKIVGFDSGEEQMKALKEGKLEGLIVQNPYAMGYATVIAAARAIQDSGNEAIVDTGYTWVTKDNMDKSSIKKMLY